MPKRTSDPKWQAIRRQVLEEEPVCHWCRRAPSTEADHIIPWDAGGTEDRDNLVGSCKPCNGRRGARYRNHKHAGVKNGLPTPKPWAICQWCGIEFRPNPDHKTQGKYCSTDCFGDSRRKPSPSMFRHEWSCAVCGTWSTLETSNDVLRRVTCGTRDCQHTYNVRQAHASYHTKNNTELPEHVRLLEVKRKLSQTQPQPPVHNRQPNSRKGLRLENGTVTHTPSTDSGRIVSLRDTHVPPAPSLPSISLIESGGPRFDPEPAEEWTSGPIAPRLLTPTLGGEDWADQIAQFAHDHLGTDLWPWQLDILRGVTQHQGDAFTHRWGLFSTARQNGKTKLIAALIGWWITSGRIARGGPQQVLSVAHKLDTAEQIAYQLFPTLETVFGFDCWQSSGRMIARHDDGSIWRIQSATPKAGHGTTNDLLVVDELFDINEVVLNSGLLPTQRARPNPLAVFCSTAGTEASTAFRRWRERGIKIVETGVPDRLFFAEWSPPPNVDPSDRRYWHMANPALGCGFLTMQDIEDEWRSPDRDAFIRSGLNMWTAAQMGWIPHGIWETLLTTEPMPDGGFLAVDSDLAENGYSAVRAVTRPDGLIQVRHEFTVDRLADVWPAIDAVSPTTRPILALTPGLAQVAPPLMADHAVTVGRVEMQRFTQLVRNTILERQLIHGGQVMFSEHVARAVPVTASGALTLSSSRSPGPIELARCMVWAVGLALKPVRTGKPEFGRARS